MKNNIGSPLKKAFIGSMIFLVSGTFLPLSTNAQTITPAKIDALKTELMGEIDKQQKMTQEMVDMVFSFGELGFQEVETSKYLTGILKENGFTIEQGISGIPTAWTAKWGSGKPVIAIGSDIDCIPKASQKPGVAYHDPIIEGAPGHGEGHNSGAPLNIVAMLALKKIMQREKLSGTLVLWPGVAEEQLATKAYYVRDGYFKNVDACIFTHVSNNLSTGYGPIGTSGMISVKFNFEGEAAHAAAAPWKGRSALDAVELMNVSWNMHREHMLTSQRSHYVIVDGGDQPNVVPSKASVWYYFREQDYPLVMKMYKDGIKMAEAAASMTDTKMTYEVLGSAWPGYMNQPIAETMYENIKQVGLPTWSEADKTLALATQIELNPNAPDLQKGLATTLSPIGKAVPGASFSGGGSDDIGDISWNVPTIVLGYPANISGLKGHDWASAIAMATPIAHKGVTAGAKAEALTVLDMLVKPEILKEAWKYFNDVQTKDVKYTPMISKTDKPAVSLNKKIMNEYRPEMTKFYYNPAKYKTYLEQLGIKYPTVRPASNK
ncbi:Catalyzes the cleavage of p-aminobenzoyl-glutamate to p-aminobenzoate and glutamate, subunit A [Arcticibacter svalbardensis MN12-7]|uniref:Catalyzes the cleavage of p-aminobenzoyl-glutamate to p-aminobenzoate and glutamate, subunit A n=1 Tax=Arcticibacter svalbardensis MN12-7 TaxID=1150600 RepID=R9GVU3_9SPHI|nr:amidohydrolase [Arcticibacter svalbardensis]EOR93049.1 Catalyzes the cleavage of p-aminobenzoyl-glutamate to p-aminobenzoate and glutamate, subunit A [Arcticibacter svalbardensis MN12-7]